MSAADDPALLTVGDLRFALRRSPRRRTVQITVDRGGELVLSAPEDCSLETMEAFVREKRFWVYTKLAQKEALRAEAPRKHFANGQGFPYLGRSYRLLLVDDQEVPIKLARGRLRLRRADAGAGRRHLIGWYTAHARPWLRKRLERFALRVDVFPQDVVVQDLGYRWGSCGKGDRVYFHWRAILLPPPIVEYIVVHELVHLREPHHTPEFWTRLERALPDFVVRKQWLAENAARAATV